MARGGLVQALAFTAQHDRSRGRVFHLIMRFGTAFVEPVNPVAALFQLVERAVNIGDADHRNIGERTRGRARDSVREPCGAAFGDDDGDSSRGVGGADDGSEVVWILDAV